LGGSAFPALFHGVFLALAAAMIPVQWLLGRDDERLARLERASGDQEAALPPVRRDWLLDWRWR